MGLVPMLTCPGLLFHGPLDGCKVVLHAGIVGVDLESLLVRIIGTQEVALPEKRSALAPPSLGPVGLQLCGLLRILQCVVPVLLRGMRSGSVAVENVVVGVDGDGLCKLVAVAWCQRFGYLGPGSSCNLHGLVVVLRGNGLVAKSFELVRSRHVWGVQLNVWENSGYLSSRRVSALEYGVCWNFCRGLMNGGQEARLKNKFVGDVVAAQSVESFDVFRWLSDVLIGAS